MPLYEYACQNCGHRFEVRQGIREDSLTTCPTCGGKIRRVIHPVGIVFKGSGFYKTDSRAASQATSEASAPAASAESAATATAASAAKSDPASSAASSSSGATASTGAESASTAKKAEA